MSEFSEGEEVYYVDFTGNRITYETIQGIDVIDGHPRYWLNKGFGYVSGGQLYRTKAQALDKLYRWNNQK